MTGTSRTSRLPITAQLVIYNEEDTLARCLGSFADLVDEIQIVHDGPCSDDSLRIAAQYGAEVFIWPRRGNCEHQRSQLIARANNEWVLQLDADEYLSEDLRTHLGDLLEGGADVYAFRWPMWHNGRYYPYGYKRALYKRHRIYHVSVNHEYPRPVSPDVVIRNSELLLEHRPRKSHFSWESFKTRLIPRAKRHANRLTIPFSDLDKWNCPFEDWGLSERIRLKNPILIGIPLTFFFLLLKGFLIGIKQRSIFYLKSSIILSVWHASVYFFYSRQIHRVQASRKINNK